MTATNLDSALKAAGVPIVGVSIGRKDDKATWRVDYAESATPEQRTAAQAIVAAFDMGAVDDTPVRDPLAEIDALKASVARLPALEAAAIDKGLITKDDVDAKVEAKDETAIKGP